MIWQDRRQALHTAKNCYRRLVSTSNPLATCHCVVTVAKSCSFGRVRQASRPHVGHRPWRDRFLGSFLGNVCPKMVDGSLPLSERFRGWHECPPSGGQASDNGAYGKFAHRRHGSSNELVSVDQSVNLTMKIRSTGIIGIPIKLIAHAFLIAPVTMLIFVQTSRNTRPTAKAARQYHQAVL
jgi:hypothetical protein